MQQPPSIKRDDEPSGPPPGAGVNLSHLLGTWINTYRETRSLSRFTLKESAAGYSIETQTGERDLGETPVRPFSASVDSRVADGFTAGYDFDFLEMGLSAYCAKGLLVVLQHTRFKDGSGRPDYFNREFFFKEEA